MEADEQHGDPVPWVYGLGKVLDHDSLTPGLTEMVELWLEVDGMWNLSSCSSP